MCNDVDIFREALATWLKPGERVETDDGYIGEVPLRVKCSGSISEPKEKREMTKFVRACQETINKCSSSGVFCVRSIVMTWFASVMSLLPSV